MTFSMIPPRSRWLLLLSLATVLASCVLLFTRFGVFLVFDVLADVGAADTSGAAYHDAPLTVSAVLSDPTEIRLPRQIEQVSGILKIDNALIVSTDQSEVFSMNLSDPENTQGRTLFPTTPLLMRQGRLEAIARGHDAYHLVGEYGAVVQLDDRLTRQADLPLPKAISAHEFSGMTVGPDRFFFTADDATEVLLVDRQTGAAGALALDYGAFAQQEAVLGDLRWSGLAYDNGLLYLAGDVHPIIVVAEAETGVVKDVFGIEGALQFSDIAVSDGKVYLPRDHNYFDPRPPILVFDLHDTARNRPASS